MEEPLMKRQHQRSAGVCFVLGCVLSALSACAGKPTALLPEPDTLSTWASWRGQLAASELEASDARGEGQIDAEAAADLPAAAGDVVTVSDRASPSDVAAGAHSARPQTSQDATFRPAASSRDEHTPWSARENTGTPQGLSSPAGSGLSTAQPLGHPGTSLSVPHGLTPVSIRAGDLSDLGLNAPVPLPGMPELVVAPLALPMIAPSGTLEPGQTPVGPEAVGASDVQDLWTRIRGGLSMTDLDGPLVRNWERWYADRPDYVQRMVERASRYLFHIVEEVERRGLPAELALLPFIESAFNPQALSGAKASGIWQFMPATGKDFDLTQNLFRDDRRHVLASTDAALSYLQMLHGMFGDWHLALAAYNWGQGSVQRALDRQSRNGPGRPTYEQLSMPAETRNYVPKLQAVENILRDPAAFGLTLPPLENHPYFATVAIDRDIDVALAARLAGLSMDDFHALNPQLNKPVILAAGTPEILLPYDNAQRFETALAAHEGARATWTAWVAPRTLHPRDAARQTGLTEARLREINRIPKGMLIRVGSTLVVPRPQGRQSDVSSAVADTARISLAPDGPRLQRKVVRAKAQGERLSALARRYGVSARNVAAWNGLTADAMLKPRQSVVLMLPNRPASKSAVPVAPPVAKKPASKSVAKR